MGNAGGQELVGSFGKYWTTKCCIWKKNFKFLKLEGMHSQDRNQSWYVFKQINYFWEFSCIFDVIFFLPQIVNIYIHLEKSM